jgi:hypothetical protein
MLLIFVGLDVQQTEPIHSLGNTSQALAKIVKQAGLAIFIISTDEQSIAMLFS